MQVRLKSNGDYWQACCPGHPAKSLGSKSRISRRAALTLCSEWEFQLRFQGIVESVASLKPAAPTLSEWLERYTSLRSELSAGTREVNAYCGRYLQRHFPTDPLIDRIDRQQAAGWRAALAAGTLSKENGRHTDPPGEQTICKYVRAARRIFAEALDQDLIRLNPFDRLKGTPPRPLRDWAYLTDEDMTLIYDACPNDGWRAFFALLRFAGLRRGEALRLRWVDVNFERNRMCVSAAGTIDRIDTKHRPRMVPIETARRPNGLASVLHKAFTSASAGAVRVCESVCSDNPKSMTNVNTRAARIVVAAGIARYTKIHHTLRKNAEQDWAAHYPQHVVCEWAGHSIDVAADHYLRVPEELYALPQKQNPTNSVSVGLQAFQA